MAGKVVVTGAAGFIGSHLAARLLAEGYDVVGVDSIVDYYDVRVKRDNLSGLLASDRFLFIEDSINNIDLDDLLEGVDTVFHQAAQAGVRASWGTQFEEYIDSNIRATQALCEAAKNRPLKRLVYASSSSIYGETAELPMKETHATRPVSPYGVTKLDGENLCLLYAHNHAAPVVSLRYFTVYGPRQRPDMAFHRFIRAALTQSPIDVYGNGTQTRDFTYVDDIVAANLAAMDYHGQERVFNVGGGSRVSLNHVLDLIGRTTGRELDVRFSDRQRGDVTHTFADCELARRELGYTPSVTLEEGIEREIEWIESIYRRLDGDDR
jgi:nucleoside-diphosphate-sugar epimerase